ncbi:N-acetylmuramoyl-L-alanine amidase [Gammaproteobacteria bacterium]|nr:N-acetylmuramoyl-L-alanine amidase [Gammaproteobacteria bacterium]
MKKLIAIACLFLISIEAYSLNQVEFVSIQELSSDEVRITFKLDKVALIKSYSLDEPSRIVIDIKESKLKGEFENKQNYPVKKIRANQDGSTARIVLDLYESVYWKKPWQIEKDGYVLLIFEIKKDKELKKNLRDIIVAIDAGHGGRDPGAVGKLNILEKDITLLIAKELERTLRDTKGYKPVMIRKDDSFVDLNDRYQNARKVGADIFISIHADAFRLASVKGVSVFVWSEEASSITAENLSKKELATNPEVKAKIGKLDVNDFDEDAARTLYQLVYEAKIENSIVLGNKILDELRLDPYTRLHKKNVEFADFRVLKSIDIPSVLVESGFLSNPEDAARLKGKPGRRMIARSIFLGIHDYFKEKPKPNTFMDPVPLNVEYTIQKGDVISEIAIRFGVNVEAIIKLNSLENKSIFPGQKIKIAI